jgi:energy-coupling factor transporter transmembrane protein EcfT
MKLTPRKYGNLLAIIAAILTIIGFLDTYFFGAKLPQFLHQSVSIPVWLFIVIIFGLGTIFLWSSGRNKLPDRSLITNDIPIHEITSRRSESVLTISSEFLKSPRGTFSAWVYLQPFGSGIRKLENNRYIFAHATNKGKPKDFEGKRRYVNVVALSRGPRHWSPPREPCWKFWIANNEGMAKSWSFNDSEGVQSGWHHFLFRWDHDKVEIELLIDGDPIIKTDEDCRQYWPSLFDNQALVGTWPSLNSIHFIETKVARVKNLPTYMTDEDVKLEMNYSPKV